MTTTEHSVMIVKWK